MRKIILFLVLLMGITFSCTTEHRGDQGEYSEGDNEINKKDSVANEDNY